MKSPGIEVTTIENSGGGKNCHYTHQHHYQNQFDHSEARIRKILPVRTYFMAIYIKLHNN